MDNMPQEWFEKIPNTEKVISELETITNKVYEIFENIDLLKVKHLSKKNMLALIRKIDFVYYQFTGDEDAIGTGYNFKSQSLISSCQNIGNKIIKDLNIDPIADKELLHNSILCELSVNIVYYIFCAVNKVKE
jgi:hypothetical protein